MALTDEQIDQYSRQIILPELGGIGQRRLLGARALLLGGGPAFECAATYLAGAGLGAIDFTRPETAGAFSRLEERNHDVTLGTAAADLDLGAYDVALRFGPPTNAPRGHTKYGEVGAHFDGKAMHVDIIPASIGCLACAAPAPAPGGGEPCLEALQAGAMAALAALLWTAEITAGDSARRLSLTETAPTWVETALRPTASCPRPCRE